MKIRCEAYDVYGALLERQVYDAQASFCADLEPGITTGIWVKNWDEGAPEGSVVPIYLTPKQVAGIEVLKDL